MFVKIGEVSRLLNVCQETLRNRAKDGQIPFKVTDGGTRLFYVIKRGDKYFIGGEGDVFKEEDKVKSKIVYCRVSTSSQKEDLERQVVFAKREYPDHEVVKDVGSGLNWKRKGLLKTLSESRNESVEEIVVIHRDRLCRFGFELLEEVFRLNGTKLLVHNEEFETSKEQQLAEDILAILQVFAARRNGLRKYKDKTNFDKKTERDLKELHGRHEVDV